MIKETRKLRPAEWALMLYVFLIPLEDFLLQDLLGSTTRIAGTAMILLYIFTERRMRWNITPLNFYLYFTWAALSIMVWAGNPDYYSIFRLFMWMLTTLIAANIIARNSQLIPLIFKAYIIACLYLAYLALVDFSQHNEELERVDVEGINQNLLASHFLICIVFILFTFLRLATPLFNNNVSIGLLLLFSMSVITTGSRAAMLSIFIGFLLILPKRSLKLNTFIKTGAIIALAFYFLVSTDNIFSRFLSQRIEQAQSDKGANRLIIWKVANNMIEDNLLIGVGYRNFPTEFATYVKMTSLDDDEWDKLGDRRYAGTHNAVLETLSELGIIGLIFFYGFQIQLLLKLYRYKSKFSLIAIVLLLSININSLFGDLANLKYFWLVIAICIGVIMHALKEKKMLQLQMLSQTES